MDLPKLFNSLSSTPIFVFLALSLFSGIILFSDVSLLSTIGLKAFQETYFGMLGLIFLFSNCILMSKIIIIILNKLKNISFENNNNKVRKTYINNLTYDEKTYLKPYIINETNTQYFHVTDGVCGGLFQKGILYRASPNGDMIHGFPYNINPWAKDLLTEKKDFFINVGDRNRTPYEEYLNF